MTVVAKGPAATFRFTVNATPVEVRAPGGRRLLDVLRHDLGLTGTKEGCGEGECGACSVLVDGEVVDSCLVPLCQADGHDVRTVEGLADDGRLDPLQAAFLETGGAQCGICTPGMLMAAHAFLASGTEPTDEAIREAIAGNICRCTGYTKIVDAIALAAGRDGGGSSPVVPATAALPVVPATAALPVVPATAARTAIASGGPEMRTPRSLAEALAMLAAPGVRPIAGGTDVMVGLAAGTIAVDERFVDIRGLDELRGIDEDNGELVLGALTTYSELRRSALVADLLPVLAEAAATIGAAQIQNRGTIGGNVVNASPAGDMLPILLATDARLELVSEGGERSVPATEFWTGYRRTARRADELLARIRIPLMAGRTVRYRKVGTRRAQAISKVVMAVAWREDGGVWRDVRIGLGSVAERPVRAPAAEAILDGSRADPGTAERAARAVMSEITPIDDVRSTADYRRAVTGRILRRIVLESDGA